VSVDLPATTRGAEAAPGRPCLALRVSIDPAVVEELLAESTAPPPGPVARGLGVIDLDPWLLDAVRRFLDLLDPPHEVAVPAPLVLREITFRLLTGPQGRGSGRSPRPARPRTGSPGPSGGSGITSPGRSPSGR
jgi:hypothetical protein